MIMVNHHMGWATSEDGHPCENSDVVEIPSLSRPACSDQTSYNTVKLLKLNFEEHFLLYALDDGTIIFVTSLCESVLGVHPLTLVGRNVYDLLRPEDILAVEGCLSDGMWYQVQHFVSGIIMWTELDEVLMTDSLEKCISTAHSQATTLDNGEIEYGTGDVLEGSPSFVSTSSYASQYGSYAIENGLSCDLGSELTDHGLHNHVIPDVVSEHQRYSEGLYTNGSSFTCRDCRGHNQVAVRCSACQRSFCEACAVAKHQKLAWFEASRHQIATLDRGRFTGS